MRPFHIFFNCNAISVILGCRWEEIGAKEVRSALALWGRRSSTGVLGSFVPSLIGVCTGSDGLELCSTAVAVRIRLSRACCVARGLFPLLVLQQVKQLKHRPFDRAYSRDRPSRMVFQVSPSWEKGALASAAGVLQMLGFVQARFGERVETSSIKCRRS